MLQIKNFITFTSLNSSSIFLRVFIGLMLVLYTSYAAPLAVPAAPVEIASDQNLPSIYNFGQVSTKVWRGSLPNDKSLHDLAKSGIKTIIDLRYDGSGCKHEEQLANKLGLKYIHMPVGFGKLTTQEIISFLKVVVNPSNLPVYIHCRQGADRTGSLIASYRIVVENWTFDKAYKEMRSYHFKPWLFSMKKSVSRMADDELAQKSIRLAFAEEQSSEETD